MQYLMLAQQGPAAKEIPVSATQIHWSADRVGSLGVNVLLFTTVSFIHFVYWPFNIDKAKPTRATEWTAYFWSVSGTWRAKDRETQFSRRRSNRRAIWRTFGTCRGVSFRLQPYPQKSAEEVNKGGDLYIDLWSVSWKRGGNSWWLQPISVTKYIGKFLRQSEREEAYRIRTFHSNDTAASTITMTWGMRRE